jgi:hypothetical protein
MTVTTNQQMERLASIRERLGTARDRRATARRTLATAQQAQDQQAIQVAESALDASQEEIEVCQGLERALLSHLVGGGREIGVSLGQNLDAVTTLREIAASTAPLRANVAIGDFLTLDETLGLTGRALEAALTVPAGGGSSGFVGPIAPPTPPNSLLDFFASVPFETRQADVMRRDGVADAAIQTAGSVKHQANLVYSATSVRAVVVASWIKVLRIDMDDVDALLGDLRDALTYGVLRKVEDLLLNGAPADPDGPAVDGILDVATSPTIAATNLADAVGEAKATLIDSGVTPNFVAAAPATIEAEEARTGNDGHYVGAIGADGTIRRLPIVESTALADDAVLIGDSRIGAALGVRQGVSVVVGQESDDMTRNRCTALSEGRWCPLVAVPSAFAYFTLA